MFIVTKHTHMNDRGMQIEEHEIVVGEAPPDFARFVGVATIGIQTPRGTYPHTFGFPIDVGCPDSEGPKTKAIGDKDRLKGLAKAFDLFKESLEKAAPAEMEKLKQQMMDQQKQLIVPASAVPDVKGKIIT